MKFNVDMIGKIVKEISTGDTGFVESECHDGLHPAVWVKWSHGYRAWIYLDQIIFCEDTINQQYFEEITINGKRYKLVPVEE